jgi:hypothetical protein
MRDGIAVRDPRPTFQDLQAEVSRNLAGLPAGLAALAPSAVYAVDYSDALRQLRDDTRERLNARA